jgi:hypothetical protein
MFYQLAIIFSLSTQDEKRAANNKYCVNSQATEFVRKHAQLGSKYHSTLMDPALLKSTFLKLVHKMFKSSEFSNGNSVQISFTFKLGMSYNAN